MRPIGLWSEVVLYVRERVPFGTQMSHCLRSVTAEKLQLATDLGSAYPFHIPTLAMRREFKK